MATTSSSAKGALLQELVGLNSWSMQSLSLQYRACCHKGAAASVVCTRCPMAVSASFALPLGSPVPGLLGGPVSPVFISSVLCPVDWGLIDRGSAIS